MTAKPAQGTSIIFVNSKREVLLHLRDDKPGIPFPGCWDLPGGHVEEGETPAQCIEREMEEELGIAIAGFHLFQVHQFPDRLEHTYWQPLDIDIETIRLTEGQKLEWFSEARTKEINLAFGFNDTLSSFFLQAPFKAGQVPAAEPPVR